MPDVDVFELRFAAAYRRYLDEAETGVDAAGVARSVARGVPHRHVGTMAWPARAVPVGAWLLLLAALLGTAVAGAWLMGRQAVLPVVPVTSDPPSAAPSGLAGLTGTWSDAGPWQALLALHPCAPGEVCGRFELKVDNGAGPRCVYTLENRLRDGDTYAYWTVDAKGLGGWAIESPHCSYDYLDVQLNVRAKTAGSVVVWQEGVPGLAWTLSRISDQYATESPSTSPGSSSGG